MKRRSHRSLHTAMQGGQLVECGNGTFIRENKRDGAAFGRIGGLTLCGGLGLGHGSNVQCGAKVDHRHLLFSQHGRIRRAKGAAETVGAGSPQEDAAKSAVLLNGDGHFVLRVGPIPTMWGSSHVTSDNASVIRRTVNAPCLPPNA